MKKLYSLALEQKEDAKHGETFFPVQKYLTRLDRDYPVVTTHWHEEAELTFIKKGQGAYQIDLVDYKVKEGDILFVDEIHRLNRMIEEILYPEMPRISAPPGILHLL